jgi:hypothetical protein
MYVRVHAYVRVYVYVRIHVHVHVHVSVLVPHSKSGLVPRSSLSGAGQLGSDKQGRAGQWVKGGANRVSL